MFSNELRADANSKLQLLFTLYVLIHLRSVVVDSSITLGLVYFKHIYADSVYKSLLDRNWISRTCIAPHIEYALKQSMMAVIERKIVDHPKMARIAEIASLLHSEWEEDRNRNGIKTVNTRNVPGTEVLENGKMEADDGDDAVDAVNGGDGGNRGDDAAKLKDYNRTEAECVEEGKPPRKTFDRLPPSPKRSLRSSGRALESPEACGRRGRREHAARAARPSPRP